MSEALAVQAAVSPQLLTVTLDRHDGQYIALERDFIILYSVVGTQLCLKITLNAQAEFLLQQKVQVSSDL